MDQNGASNGVLNEPPPIEQVLEALNQLYHAPATAGNKESVSRWLEQLQKSVFAWKIADTILSMGNLSVEVCYFAAQTMRTKILYQFAEVPREAYKSLQDSLLSHCLRAQDGTPDAIVTQLALALADLMLQVSAWKNSVNDVLQRFAPDPRNCGFLLEFLTVLPEEMTNTTLRLGSNRRQEVGDELRHASELFLSYLNACLTQNLTVQQRQRLFRSLDSWLSAGALPEAQILRTNLLQAALAVLTDVKPTTPSTVYQAASRAVCSAIRLCEDLKLHRQLAETLFAAVCELEEPYHLATALQASDRCLNLVRVFTELAETFLHQLLAGQDNVLGSFKPMELCLAAASHPEPEVAETTFSFWYYLADQLYVENGSVAVSRCHSAVERLLLALTKQAQLNAEFDGESIPDDKTEKGEFRSRVLDLVQEMVVISGSTNVFTRLHSSLTEMTASGTHDWTLTEAFLFVMCGMAGNIVRDENEAAPRVLALIFTFPIDGPPALLHTSFRLVGTMAPWLASHPSELEAAFNFILRGIHAPKMALAVSAADSLEKIVAENRDKMSTALPVLLDIIRSVDRLNLNLVAICPLLNATALALSPLPHETLSPTLEQLVVLQLEPLQHLILQAKNPTENGSDESTISVVAVAAVNKAQRHSRRHPGHWLDRIAAIFSALASVSHVPVEVAHPYQTAVDRVWPVLTETGRVFGSDNFTAERCCRCIRYSLRCLKRHATAILPTVAGELYALYAAHRHSCFIYVASILVDEFAMEPQCQEGLLHMTEALAQLSFTELSSNEHAMQDRPELVDDMFRLFVRFLQRAPTIMLRSPSGICRTAIECAIAGLPLQHRDAHESLTHFLREFVRLARDSPTARHSQTPPEAYPLAVDLFASLHGRLLDGIIHAGAIQLPIHLITDLAELLHDVITVCKNQPQIGLGCLHSSVQNQLPRVSSTGSLVATDSQLSSFQQQLEQGRSPHEIYVALKNFQRLYR